jgi:hypothetical protein
MNKNLYWEGPYTLLELFERNRWPTNIKIHSNGVYLVSRLPWKDTPTRDCQPLYVGSITGKSNRFWARLGDTIIDTLGFFNPDGPGHSSGGKSLNQYCMDNLLKPWEDLYFAWVECECHRCLEVDLELELSPQLNHNRPPYCSMHKHVSEEATERMVVK